MARFSTSVQTPLSPEDAFAYMADLSNFARWDPGVTNVNQVTGTGPGPGAVYDVSVDGVGGSTMELRYEITTYSPPHEVVAVADTGWLRSDDRITVKPSGGGSIVTYDAKLTLKSLLAIFDPLLGIAFERIGRKAESGLIGALNGVKV